MQTVFLYFFKTYMYNNMLKFYLIIISFFDVEIHVVFPVHTSVHISLNLNAGSNEGVLL